ncbi:MAG: hypothetical protein ABIH68_03660 [bacterium]
MKKTIIILCCFLFAVQVYAKDKDKNGLIGQASEVVKKVEVSTEIVVNSTDTAVIEEYVPKVIIEGKWGTGEGEFGMTMFEGDTVFPESVVVDSDGNIYISDYINNRIQKYTSKGGYLKSIPIESFERYTNKEYREISKKYKEKNKTSWMPHAKLSVSTIYIDSKDNIYFSGRKNIKFDKKGKRETITSNKFRKNREDFKLSANLKIEDKYDIRTSEKLENKKEKKINLIIRDIEKDKLINIPLGLFSKSYKVEFIKNDKNNNLYVCISRSIYPYYIKIFDINGKLLNNIPIRKKIPHNLGFPFIDEMGNIYQLAIIPDSIHPRTYSHSDGLKLFKLKRVMNIK